jgi:hypothetical protein
MGTPAGKSITVNGVEQRLRDGLEEGIGLL